MPKTSDVSLLPLPSTPPATGLFAKSTAAASDTSFRQTLESARQQESSRKPDEADSEDPKKATDSAAKKTSKSTKPKRANTKDAKKGEPTDDATDDGAAEATAASDGTAPAATTDDATDEDATPDEHAAAKDETAKVVGVATDPTVAATAQAVTPQAAKSAVAVKPKGEESKAAPTKRGAIVVDAKKAAQAADDSADDQSAGASADASAATTATATAATAQAVPTTPVKGAGLGTGKVESHGLMDSGSNPAATDATAAAATAAAAASAPAAPAAVDSDIESALSTIEDALASGDDGDHPAKGVSSPDSSPVAGTFQQQLQRASTPVKADAPAPVASPEVQFAEANHPKIVTGVQSQLLPNGGTMQIRLDPPELGALQVTVHMRDGVMTAAFETSNDDATRMLSHSLNQLKTVLESAGVSVEKLHVQQAPKQESQSGQDQQSGGGSREQQQEARQEQQRREMLQRMWRKLSGAGDPIDFVA